MTHPELKAALVEECRKKQQLVVDNLKTVMNEAQQSANEYGPPKDRYDSYRMQLLRKRDMYAQQLEKALAELYALEKIETKKESKVAGFGSVVITEEHKIFISIGLGKLEISGDTFIAVSVMVPLARAFAGKAKGDTAEFSGKKFKIIDLF